ncbi:MAG: type III-A CRISPR-associated RAMP protein Csm3 [Lachnospiraceae bacterium]|nr:type III-A CRISPR-associated RAMP protein Csm3 [Lachnospiraceae bacterium]
MYAKIEITGKVMIKTGMHIGGSDAFSAIGAIDSPVMKDPISGYPIIPGSSLKGKMRALLAKEYNQTVAKTPDDDCKELTDLFGTAKKDANGVIKASRVIFSDMILSNWEELKKKGLTSNTEVKFENTISRTTAVANPRQIERVVRGAEFPLSIVYEVTENADAVEDFKILKEGLKLLEYDYLGGNGSRGYGKVSFEDLDAKVVVGDVSDDLVQRCREILSK